MLNVTSEDGMSEKVRREKEVVFFFPNDLTSSSYRRTITYRCIAICRLSIIPIVRSIAFCACLLFVYSPAASETKQLASSGDWVLIRTDVISFDMSSMVVYSKDACTARTGNESDFFSVTIVPGVTLLQISLSQWDWPKQERDVKVVGGNANVLFEDAIYLENFIQHVTKSDNGVNSLVQNLARQPGKIKVFDYRNKLVARFSSRGFTAMLDKAIQCSQERYGLETN